MLVVVLAGGCQGTLLYVAAVLRLPYRQKHSPRCSRADPLLLPTSHALCKARADASSLAASDTYYPSSEASHDAHAQLSLEGAP